MRKILFVILLMLAAICVYAQTPVQPEYQWIVGRWEGINIHGNTGIFIFNENGTGKAGTTNIIFSIKNTTLTITFLFSDLDEEKTEMIIHKTDNQKITLYHAGVPLNLNKIGN